MEVVFGSTRPPRWHRLTRRELLVDLGWGGVAVAVLGGCSSSSPSTPPKTLTPSLAPTADPATTGGTATSAQLTWSRANLGFVSAYVLVRGRQAAVVDTGVAGSADAIGAVLDSAGPGWAGVRHVVLTHKHGDHAGSIGEV